MWKTKEMWLKVFSNIETTIRAQGKEVEEEEK